MKEVNVENGPFIKSKNSTSKIMFHLFIALLPIILFSFYKNGIIPYNHGTTDIKGLFLPLVVIIVPTLTSLVTEMLYASIFLKKDALKYIKNSYSIFPGLFLGLIMPLNTPFSMLILGAFVATLIGKLLFGGFGNNIFNPALIGRIFIISAYAVTFGKYAYHNSYELDTIASATPLSNASVVEGIGSYNELVKPYGTLTNFFVGTIPGAVGETSALLCIVGFIYLTLTKVIKWRIPVFYVGTVFIMSFIIGAFNDLERTYSLFQILSGGLMFGAVFMATDPVTSPTTPIGQTLYGIMLGLLTVIFRHLTPYPEGVLTSILTMNMFVFIIDKIGVKARFNKKKSVPYFIILIFISIFSSCYIGLKYQHNNNEIVDTNYEIYSKTINGDIVTYMVGQKGYSSTLKAKIVLNKGKVTTYEVLEQNDSYYSKVENSNYIESLIRNQEKLDSVDSIAGVTFTSNGLKKMLINTLNDYKNNKEEINGEVVIDKDFEIVEKTNDGNVYNYIVLQKSFSGKMKLNIIVTDNKITSLTVLEVNDSYYQKIVDADYLNYLINNQDNISSIDSVSGATFTSNALKNALLNTLEDLKNNKSETTKTEIVSDADFEVIEKNNDGNNYHYIVTQKSFSGNLKMDITILNNIIINATVLEVNDSYYKKIVNADYLNYLINNQENIRYIDSVSGATFTSNALKNALLNTLTVYKGDING